ALLAHPEDAADPNLPLMYWYAVEPLVPADPRRALNQAYRVHIPPVRAFIARRVGAGGTPEALTLLAGAVHQTNDAGWHLDVVRALQQALKGRRQAPAPEGWADTYDVLAQSPSEEVRRAATAVAVAFGDARAMKELRGVLARRDAAPAARQEALVALV